jgi:hypothetical protein
MDPTYYTFRPFSLSSHSENSASRIPNIGDTWDVSGELTQSNLRPGAEKVMKTAHIRADADSLTRSMNVL